MASVGLLKIETENETMKYYYTLYIRAGKII
jgi:hypothetical protein